MGDSCTQVRLEHITNNLMIVDRAIASGLSEFGLGIRVTRVGRKLWDIGSVNRPWCGLSKSLSTSLWNLSGKIYNRLKIPVFLGERSEIGRERYGESFLIFAHLSTCRVLSDCTFIRSVLSPIGSEA